MKGTTVAAIVAIASMGFAWPGSPENEALARSQKVRASLCHPNETPLFQCALGRKQVAVCASNRSESPNVQYRFGRPGKVELEYPADPSIDPGTMKWASTGWSGGGGMQIHFEWDGYQYVLYSSMVHTRHRPDGRLYPKDQLGLFVTRSGRLVFDKHCNPYAPDLEGGNEDWIDETKSKHMLPEGEYVDPPEAFYKHWERS